MTLRETLVELGAMPKRRTGPSIAMTPEEAKLARLRQCSEGFKRRKMLIDEAKAQGLPPPVFIRGRPRKYTPEEACAVRKAQCKIGYIVYRERLKQGEATIKELGLYPVNLLQFQMPR